MENVAEALRMAAGVLIFVLALSISINAFGEARQSAQFILDSTDREYDYTYINQGNETDTERYVRGETIVPSVYKAYKENYKIIFKDRNGPVQLYQRKNKNNKLEDVYCIDLEKEVLGSDEQKENFIKLLFKGTNRFTLNDSDANKKLQENGIYLKPNGLYDIIKGNRFKESLGIYYQEDLQGESNTPTANRTKKKVITYQQV